MKLHLPKMLLTAVLAACVAPVAWGGITAPIPDSVTVYGTSIPDDSSVTLQINDGRNAYSSAPAKDYVILGASNNNGRYQVAGDIFADGTTIVIGSGYYTKDEKKTTYSGGQLFVNGGNVTIDNAIILGTSSYAEGGSEGNMRLHDGNVTLSGTITLVDNALVGTNGTATYSNNISGDGYTLKLFKSAGGSTSKHILSGASVSLGGLEIGSNSTVTVSKNTALSLGSTLVNNGTFELNGTFEVKDIANYDDFTKNGMPEMTSNGLFEDTFTVTVVKGNGTVKGLSSIIFRGTEYTITDKKISGVAGHGYAVVESGKTVIVGGTNATEGTKEADYYVMKAGTLSVAEGILNANSLVYSGGSLELTAEATLSVLNNSESSKNILSNTKGAGTVELNYSTTYGDNIPKLGSDFTGTTYVKKGNFTINEANFGNKLVLNHGVNFQITGNASIEWSADKELVLYGTTQVHQNGTANLTYNGSVSGGTYDRRGGGTLTFNGAVELQELIVNGGGTTIFNGAVDLRSLIVNAGETTQLKNGGSINTLSIKGTSTAVQFSSDGTSETTLYNVGTIGTAGSNGFSRAITIDEGVQVSGTAFKNSYGLGTFTVNGVLALTGDFTMWSGHVADANVDGTNKITGSGSITANKLVVGNPGKFYTLDVAEFSVNETELSSNGITVTSGDVNLGALTLNAKLAVNGGTVGITSTTGSSIIEAKGGAINFQSGTHDLGTIDASAATAGTALTLEKGANLTASSALKLAANNSTINLEDTATLTRGNLKVTGTSDTNGTAITRVTETNGGGDVYTISNNTYVISNAKVEIAAAANGETVSNRLNNVALTNTGSGQLKVGNGHNLFSEIHATNGNIFIGGMNNASAAVQQGTLKAISVGAEKTLGVHTNWYDQTSIDATTDLATLNVAETVTLGAGAKLYANLAMVSSVQRNATTTILTLSGTGENAATIYGDFTLTKGSLTLAGDVLKAIMDIEEGGTLDILAIGGKLIVDGETISTALTADSTSFSFSDVFTNTGYDDYYLGYTLASGDGSYNTLYIGKNIPEPTTATLSLLALAALAARRRRK